jgi:hypothetical protein
MHLFIDYYNHMIRALILNKLKETAYCYFLSILNVYYKIFNDL